MARLIGVLALLTGLAFAQDDGDGSGISVDEKPSGQETEPAAKKTTPNPPRAPGKKPATTVVKKKAYSLTLPADWVLQDFEDSKTELSWDVLLPGSTTRASLSLVRQDRVDPRSWPYYQAEWFRKERPDEGVEIRLKPSPRLVVKRKLNDTDWNDAYFCVSARGNAFLLQLSCSASDFAQAEADLLATARSFDADVEPFPPVPKGYEVSQEGTWLVARAPSVTTSLAPLVKVLKDEEKRFRREHGALPKGDGALLVLVHASRAEGEKIAPELFKQANRDIVADYWNRRLFAIPFAKDNMEMELGLVGEAHGLLFVAKYGDYRPDWILLGERTVARAEAQTGKALPSLHEGYCNWASTLKLHRVDELEGISKSDPDGYSKECFFIVAALREGKYRKQYRAFLDDYGETADGPGAFARHLGTIDQEDMKAATNQYMSRIRPEKPK